MKLLKNPEVNKELLIVLLITAVLSAAGFILHLYAGIAALVTGLIFCILYLLHAARRYRRMAELSDHLDKIIHGQEQILLNDQDEGELAILKSEIGKMTLRLKEQTALLTDEKLNLSRAIEDIFHQIRTPLTAMNLNAELLKNPDLSYEDRLRLARTLSGQIERIQWLVESLLKMAQIDAGVIRFEEEPFRVANALEEAASPLQIQAEIRDIRLNIRAGEEKITGDLRWTTEAIGNLVKNALEHTPDGGVVALSSEENALYTEIRISDSGEGFDPEDLPHIFDRFYKGKNAGSGSIGIGLALTRAIITAQNGTIRADNTQDGGAVFVLKFYKNVI